MALVVYSLLRLALLVAALAVGWAVGLRGWLLVVVATVVAWAVSYLALHRQRTAAALWLAERAERRRRGARRISAEVDSDALAEDAEADHAGRGPGARPASEARSHGEAEPEQDAVGELEGTGAREDGPQQDAPRTEQHRDDEDPRGHREQQHQQ